MLDRCEDLLLAAMRTHIYTNSLRPHRLVAQGLLDRCEDSLLAAPIILDLILVTELFGRIQLRRKGAANFQRFHVSLRPHTLVAEGLIH